MESFPTGRLFRTALGGLKMTSSRRSHILQNALAGRMADLRRKLGVAAVPYQIEEFGTSSRVFAEMTEHGRGHCVGVLLFYASHHHAEMLGFNDNAHTLGAD